MPKKMKKKKTKPSTCRRLENLEQRIEELQLSVDYICEKTVEERIQTSCLELVDKCGKVSAALTMINGGPVLFMYDQHERPRIALTVNQYGPKMNLYDENGRGLNVTVRGRKRNA